MSSSSTTSRSSCSSNASNGMRKQILELKPKSTVFGQRYENKPKKKVPVTTLQLKSKTPKVEKNIVTNLVYRTPGTYYPSEPIRQQPVIYLQLRHPRSQFPSGSHRAGSPSSSGYDTDSLSFGDVDNFENVDPYSTLSENSNPNCSLQMQEVMSPRQLWSRVNFQTGIY